MASAQVFPALLLIADISGFTRFMRMHALATSHARQIIARLLRVLVETARPPFRVAELEGDAVFFYAPGDPETTAAKLNEQVLRFFRAFDQEICALEAMTACVCDACTSVGRLRLKQVIHGGEVSIERIDRFQKLMGLDVIVVHRMLKNSVPSDQYVMMTEPAYAACRGLGTVEPERRTEMFEGLDATDIVVFYYEHLRPLVEALPDAPVAPSAAQLLLWKLKMHARTVLGLGARTEPSLPQLTRP